MDSFINNDISRDELEETLNSLKCLKSKNSYPNISQSKDFVIGSYKNGSLGVTNTRLE